MSITIYGSINLDITTYVKEFPSPGETIHASNYSIELGGKGANQAVAVRKLSSEGGRFVAAVGNDAFGAKARKELKRFNTCLDHVVSVPAATGIALIHVNESGQNTISIVGGANMSWPDTGPDPDVFHDTQVLLVQLETPLQAVRSAMALARKRGAYVILDPAPAIDVNEIKHLIEFADAITPNESECEAIIGWRPKTRDEAEKAAKELLAYGLQLAIVKLGSHGLSFACSDGTSGSVPGFIVDACDTVAAGDAFCGALAVALYEKMILMDALRFASATGALTATKPGAANAIPLRSEVDEFLLRN